MKIKENKRNYGRVLGSVVCIGGSCLLLLMTNQWEGFGEWYATVIYPVFVGTIGRLFGVFPWSVAEIGLYLTAGALAASCLYVFIRILCKKAGRYSLLSWAISWVTVCSVLLLLYTLLCGINYQRRSFADYAKLKEEPYPVSQLEALCRSLTEEVNRLSGQVERDEQGCMALSGKEQEEAVEAMEALGREYPVLAGFYPRPKRLAIPWILSVQNLTGIYSPFTVEANYNSGIIDYNIPFTACHELSHLRGFMEEEEANFIAYLACIHSDKEEFQYSGNLLAWIYAMNALYEGDREIWKSVRTELNVEVEADLDANRDYWKQYEGPVAEVSNKVNDTYLKANGQEDGVRSYDRMVDLLVAYQKKAMKAA